MGFQAYLDILKQSGGYLSYFRVMLSGDGSLRKQWLVFFSYLPEFLKYVPSNVRDAFWEKQPASTSHSNDSDRVAPNKIILPNRGSYSLQDVMTEEEEQQENLKLQQVAGKKRKLGENAQEESKAPASKRRRVNAGRKINYSQTQRPPAATAAPPAATAAPPAPVATGTLALSRGITSYAWPPGRLTAYSQMSRTVPRDAQQRPHHHIASVAPPPQVNLAYLSNIPVSAVEFLTVSLQSCRHFAH